MLFSRYLGTKFEESIQKFKNLNREINRVLDRVSFKLFSGYNKKCVKKPPKQKFIPIK